MSILDKIKEKSEKKIKEVFIEFMEFYLTPAFGSVPKREIDIFLFSKLQDLGVIDKEPELYDLIKDLRITRAKAKNLLYEANLRRMENEKQLEKELVNLLKNPILLKEGDKILLEITNPCLTDFLKAELKKLGHITDGSFSNELVRLTQDAFVLLLDKYIDDKKKDELKKVLEDLGATPNTSFRGILKEVVKKVGEKVANESGKELVNKYFDPLLDGAIEIINEKFVSLFKKEGEK